MEDAEGLVDSGTNEIRVGDCEGEGGSLDKASKVREDFDDGAFWAADFIDTDSASNGSVNCATEASGWEAAVGRNSADVADRSELGILIPELKLAEVSEDSGRGIMAAAAGRLAAGVGSECSTIGSWKLEVEL